MKEYVYLDSQPLAQIATGSPEVLTYLHTDNLGTPRYATNTAGTQVWAWAMDAFGVSTPTGTVTVNLRLPGQYFDTESSLFYNWNRYYNPNIGRYISPDPIGQEGGLNLFSYVGQSPIMFKDMSGLDIYVIVNNNDPVIGTHVGTFVTTLGKPDKNVLYDAGGSFQLSTRGSGDAFFGGEADLKAYIQYQKKDGNDVKVFRFITTPQEDDIFRQNIDDQSGCMGGMCAICSGNVLRGTGPFKSLGSTKTPAGMARELQAILDASKPKKSFFSFFEDNK